MDDGGDGPVSVASQWGRALSLALVRTNAHTTPVSQATLRHDPELARLRQADAPPQE